MLSRQALRHADGALLALLLGWAEYGCQLAILAAVEGDYDNQLRLFGGWAMALNA